MINFKTLGLAASFAALGAVASAATINFDDIRGRIADGYNGLDWSNFGVLNTAKAKYNGSGYENGTTSGTHVAYNRFGHPAAFSSSSDFTLNSFEITGAWRNSLSVLITGYENGILAFTQQLLLNVNGPTLVTLNWAGIDSVGFESSGGFNAGLQGDGTQFALDDLTFNASPVPLPAALPLLAAALAGMGFAARRRRTKR